jgi:Zn ribbon nucleic-acid-binding protein
MSMCTVCRRTAPDGQHICPAHAADLRAWLAELPGLVDDLAEFIAPAGRPHQGRLGGTGRAHSPAPVDLRVLALLGPGHAQPPSDDPDAGGTIPIRALLDAWCGRLAYDHPAVWRDRHGTAHTAPCEAYRAVGGRTITGWCAFLTAYLPYATTRPWIGELHHQLGDLVAHIRDLTHITPRRHPREAPCPRCEAFRLTTTDGQPDVQCNACGHRMSTEDYTQHAADFHHSLTRAETPVPH